MIELFGCNRLLGCGFDKFGRDESYNFGVTASVGATKSWVAGVLPIAVFLWLIFIVCVEETVWCYIVWSRTKVGSCSVMSYVSVLRQILWSWLGNSSRNLSLIGALTVTWADRTFARVQSLCVVNVIVWFTNIVSITMWRLVLEYYTQPASFLIRESSLIWDLHLYETFRYSERFGLAPVYNDPRPTIYISGGWLNTWIVGI